MMIGNRLRELREQKKLSQGEIEKRTGLLRCYISRVENGHTVPAVETLEKFAHALRVPLYQIFYDGEEPPPAPNIHSHKPASSSEWGHSGKDARLLAKFRQIFSQTGEEDRRLIFFVAKKMIKPKNNVRNKSAS